MKFPQPVRQQSFKVNDHVFYQHGPSFADLNPKGDRRKGTITSIVHGENGDILIVAFDDIGETHKAETYKVKPHQLVMAA